MNTATSSSDRVNFRVVAAFSMPGRIPAPGLFGSNFSVRKLTPCACSTPPRSAPLKKSIRLCFSLHQKPSFSTPQLKESCLTSRLNCKSLIFTDFPPAWSTSCPKKPWFSWMGRNSLKLLPTTSKRSPLNAGQIRLPINRSRKTLRFLT